MHKQKQQAKERQEQYDKNPKKCLECGISLAYETKHNTYCSKSCSAKHTNRKRVQQGWSPSAEHRIKIGLKLKGKKGTPSPQKGKKLVNRISLTCVECSSIFEVVPSEKYRKYCSTPCRRKNLGGAREGSGYSKSGYYKGIYCGSSYELVWVIYRLDHNLPVNRFTGYITYGEGKRYYPDFVVNDVIHEMKGWTTEKTDPILKLKEEGARKAGYKVKLYFKEDLKQEFDWVKSNYKFKNLQELYDT